MQHEQKPLKEALAPILDVLEQLGGKFTFMDENGRQFILASVEALEDETLRIASLVQGKQQELVFPQADSVAKALRKHVDSSLGDDVIDAVNRDIALAASSEQQIQGEEDEIEELIEEEQSQEANVYTPPLPPRIHFEPVKGDLAPELQ